MRRQLRPGLSHGAFDDVPLNTLTYRATKDSQIFTGAARLYRRQPHWRTAGGALWPLFCLSSKALPSVRRSEFAGKPSDDPRVQGIRCNDVYFNVIALRAFEQPLFETDGPR
jgi:hypothetical protein